jgi:hypothetical protein
VLREVDGFTTDLRLYGWEDYDLWCKLAERDMFAVHVKEIVARYRVASSSMLSLTNLSRDDAMAALAERHPTLFSSADRPPSAAGSASRSPSAAAS